MDKDRHPRANHNQGRNRSRSPSRERYFDSKRDDYSQNNKTASCPSESPPPSIDVGLIDPDDEIALMKAMGFGGFESTKGKHVPGNVHEAVHKKKKAQYRQMLRKRKLYEIPLTRQQLEEKEQQKQEAMPENK